MTQTAAIPINSLLNVGPNPLLQRASLCSQVSSSGKPKLTESLEALAKWDERISEGTQVSRANEESRGTPAERMQDTPKAMQGASFLSRISLDEQRNTHSARIRA